MLRDMIGGLGVQGELRTKLAATMATFRKDKEASTNKHIQHKVKALHGGIYLACVRDAEGKFTLLAEANAEGTLVAVVSDMDCTMYQDALTVACEQLVKHLKTLSEEEPLPLKTKGLKKPARCRPKTTASKD